MLTTLIEVIRAQPQTRRAISWCAAAPLRARAAHPPTRNYYYLILLGIGLNNQTIITEMHLLKYYLETVHRNNLLGTFLFITTYVGTRKS